MEISRPGLSRTKEVDETRRAIQFAAVFFMAIGFSLMVGTIYIIVHFLLKVW